MKEQISINDSKNTNDPSKQYLAHRLLDSAVRDAVKRGDIKYPVQIEMEKVGIDFLKFVREFYRRTFEAYCGFDPCYFEEWVQRIRTGYEMDSRCRMVYEHMLEENKQNKLCDYESCWDLVADKKED